eukprot:NODE_314_length_2256_cov_14.397825_g246_i0.p1 GENE.NODE_314_length_2256_cov_14.397825_g246_i0~~NODE_314_length_2256_cov_14.397825_g246_i0.p1  ORF type:complete len:707 (-),score=132.68 NODE_314_length_2256_cov_14.397825_g246_i0:136-2064(-)
MRVLNAQQYSFYPQTFVCTSPADLEHLTQMFRQKTRNALPQATWIVKPPSGRGGNGIVMVQDLSRLRVTPGMVVQRYVETPLLLDGLKFDLRIYALITSISPLRILLHPEGLVRLATEPYQRPDRGNLHRHFMHLTNYSLNKHSPGFVRDEDADGEGTKRRISDVNQWLAGEGYNVDGMWAGIEELIVKTMIALQPFLVVHYESNIGSVDDVGGDRAFHTVGFDVLIDSNLRPWLLEANAHPSLATPDLVDEEVKEQVVSSALHIAANGVDSASAGASTPHVGDESRRESRTEIHHPSLDNNGEIPASELMDAAVLVPTIAPPTRKASALPADAEVEDGEFELLYPDPQTSLPDYDHFIALNDSLRSLFFFACAKKAGGLTSFEFSCSRFLRFCRDAGILGAAGGPNPNAASSNGVICEKSAQPFTAAELELIYLRTTQALATPSQGFFEFTDILLSQIAPRLYPTAQTVLSALCQFFQNNCPPLAKIRDRRETTSPVAPQTAPIPSSVPSGRPQSANGRAKAKPTGRPGSAGHHPHTYQSSSPSYSSGHTSRDRDRERHDRLAVSAGPGSRAGAGADGVGYLADTLASSARAHSAHAYRDRSGHDLSSPPAGRGGAPEPERDSKRYGVHSIVIPPATTNLL